MDTPVPTPLTAQPTATKWGKYGPPLFATFTLVIGLMLGLHFRKVEIQTVEKWQTKTETKVEYKDRDVIKYVYLKAKKKDVVVHVTTTKTPDGTVVTDKTITDKTVTDTSTAAQETHTQEGKQQTTTEQTVEKKREIKIVAGLPDWRVSVKAGFNLFHPNLAEFPASGIYGIGVDRRIIGPCYLGLEGISDPKLSNPIGLLNLSCGFF